MERDEALAIHQYLRLSEELIPLVGARIYAESPFPPPEYNITQGPCICFFTRGGTTDEENVILIPSVAFKFYGRDEVEARQLYLTAHTYMRSSRKMGIINVEREALGTIVRENESAWIYVLAYYKFMIKNQ